MLENKGGRQDVVGVDLQTPANSVNFHAYEDRGGYAEKSFWIEVEQKKFAQIEDEVGEEEEQHEQEPGAEDSDKNAASEQKQEHAFWS